MSTCEDPRVLDTAALSPERLALLARRINELALKIPGTRLEALIQQLHLELAQAGLAFKPKAYLSDEWGCPDRVPIIGIPFYLADPVLSRLEGELTDIEAENEAEVMMYLRHEAGHAFNYAYRLYLQPEWQQLFGAIAQVYQDDYRTVPFSARFVRHVPGWYGQKHPDDDFAETFAVWLTPGSTWRERYADTPALAKLLYVDRVTHEYGPQPPLVTDETLDNPVEELDMTLEEWYAPSDDESACSLPAVFNEDLRRLFPASEGQPAVDVARAYRRVLVRDLHYWTGVSRQVLADLTDEVLRRLRVLGLRIEPEQVLTRMADLSIFLTTLAMNYNYTGQFVNP
jgi:hypothetical protein